MSKHEGYEQENYMANNNELLRQALSMLDRNNYVPLYSQVTDPLVSGQSVTSSRSRGPTASEAGVSDRAPCSLAIWPLISSVHCDLLVRLTPHPGTRSRCTAPRPFTYS